MNYVWIVEMKNPRNGKWNPCCSASLTKEEGQYRVNEFRTENPDDKFHLRKYVPAEDKP